MRSSALLTGLRSSALLLVRVHLDQGFQLGTTAGDFLGCHDWEGGASGFWWVEARKAAKQPMMPTQDGLTAENPRPRCRGHSEEPHGGPAWPTPHGGYYSPGTWPVPCRSVFSISFSPSQVKPPRLSFLFLRGETKWELPPAMSI